MSNDELQEAIDAITRGASTVPNKGDGGFVENAGLAEEMMNAARQDQMLAQNRAERAGAASAEAPEATKPAPEAVAQVAQGNAEERANIVNAAPVAPLVQAEDEQKETEQNKATAGFGAEASLSTEQNADRTTVQEPGRATNPVQDSSSSQFGEAARTPGVSRGLGFMANEAERTENNTEFGKVDNNNTGFGEMENKDQKAELRTKVIEALYPLLDQAGMDEEEMAEFYLKAHEAGIGNDDALRRAIEVATRIGDNGNKVRLLKEIWDFLEERQ